ncbi:MAG: hypothetical protein RIR48_81, partial [Bacteroidota bacterium]
MKIVDNQFQYKIYDSIGELTESDRELVLKAIEQLDVAYA